MARLQNLSFGIKATDEASRPLKKVRGEVDKTTKSHRNLKPVLLGAAAGFAAVGAAAAKAFSEFAAYEKSLNRVNTNLKLVGVTSQAAVKEFANIASEIQNVSTISDGAALDIQSMFLSLGAAPDQIKQAVQTTADVAAATGRSVEEIGRQIAKTFGGYAGELGETIPALKELTKEQLQAGDALQMLADRFGGAARKELNTFSGQMTQIQNLFSDFLKLTGALISTSGPLNKFFEILAASLKQVTVFLGGGTFRDQLKQQIDLFGNLAMVLESVGSALPSFLGGDKVIAKSRELAKTVSMMSEELAAQTEDRKQIVEFSQKQFEIARQESVLLREKTELTKQSAESQKTENKMAQDRLKYLDGVARRYRDIQDRQKQMAEFDRMQRQGQTMNAIRSGFTGDAAGLIGSATQVAGASAATAAMASGIAALVLAADKLPGLIDNMLQNIVEQVTNGIPKLIEYLSGDFIKTLMVDVIPALVQNLARLLPSFIAGITSAIGEIIANLPAIIGGSVKGLAKGLMDGAAAIAKSVAGLFGFGGDDRSPQQKLSETIRELVGMMDELAAGIRETTTEIKISLKGTGGQLTARRNQFNNLAAQRGRLNEQFREAGRDGDTERAAEIVQEIAANQKEQLQRAQQIFELENRRLTEIFNAEKELFDQRIESIMAEKQAAQNLIREYEGLKSSALNAFASVRESITANRLSPAQNVSRLREAFDNAQDPQARAQAAEALAGGLRGRLNQAQSLAQQGAITGEEFRRIQNEVLAQLESAESETVSEFDRLINEQQKVVERSDQQIKVLERGFERFEEGIERQRQDLEKYFVRMIDRLDAIYIGRDGSATEYWTDRSYTENRNNRRGRTRGLRG